MDAQLNRVSSQDKGARRVAFTEIPPNSKHRAAPSTASDDGDGDYEQDRKCKPRGPRCFAACAWICILGFGFILALLIVAVVFMSFLQSVLPEISIESLQFPEFEITNSTNQKLALLNATTSLAIQVKNTNDIVELSYSEIEVNVAAEDERLGRGVAAGFSHKPGNATLLNVTTAVDDNAMDIDDAMQLVEDENKLEMEIEVKIKAKVDFSVGIFSLNKVPILVTCDVQQNLLVNLIKSPLCNIRMYPTR